MERPTPHLLLVLAGRAELAFGRLRGEPVYAHALRALGEVGVPILVVADPADVARVTRDAERWRQRTEVFAGDAWWDVVRERPDRGLLVHDALCPLVGASFIHHVLERGAARPATSYVGVQAVTDTLKAVVDGTIRETVDRESVATVTSPALLAAPVLADLPAPPPVDHFVALVDWLRSRGDVELVKAPSLGRRLEDAGGVHLLESLDEVGHRVRTTRTPR